MALIKCHECGKDISTEAKTCPACGAKVKKPKKPVGPVGFFFVLVFGMVVYAMVSESENKAQREADETARERAKTPEQRAKEKAQSAKRDAQLQAAAVGALALKRAMKDPTAFDLTSLVLKPNGTACYEYRAKNSFGAILPSSAVLSASGKMLVQEKDGNAFVSLWNKECTSAGGDEIAHFLKTQGIL